MPTLGSAILQQAGFRPGASGIMFQSDNAADIGATAANRPRDVYVGRDLAVGGRTILDQGASDIEILTLRSSDVAHGMTSLTDTTTFAALQKASATEGGLSVLGFSEGASALLLFGMGTSDNTTKSNAAIGYTRILAGKKSGTNAGSPGANANLLTVEDYGVGARFILDVEGDSHQDVGTAWTNFDITDDVRLLNVLSAHVTRLNDPLRESFGCWLSESREELERHRLVTFNANGHHFVNMSRLTMLHTGALRQLGAQLADVRRAIRQVVAGDHEGALTLIGV